MGDENKWRESFIQMNALTEMMSAPNPGSLILRLNDGSTIVIQRDDNGQVTVMR